MDFMKVLDQTVREIKREVNLKVLKVPEIEQKVLDATSDEPWGPHGSALSEIAQATKKFTECQMIMNVLWMRLTEAGANWRHVYKALTVIEYLIANGSERALDDILEHGFRIASLSGFEYVEPNGKDVGINVRKKVETLVGTINDKEKVQSVRSKAAATRDKYFGLSSSGVTYKSSASSYGSSDRYGGFGNSNDGDSFKDSYKDNDRYGRDTKSDNEYGDSKSKGDKSKKGATQYSSGTSSDSSVKTSTVAADINEDEFDDFDPRGSSTSGTKNVASNQVDLFGGSLIDFMDEPTSVPTESKNVNNSATTEVDLFADATFVSASPEPQGTSSSHDQAKVDLFANQPAFPAAPAAAPVSADVDLFGASDSYLFAKPNQSVSEAESTNNFDPFAISGSSSSISKDTKSPVSEAKKTQTFDPFAISGSSSSISKDTKSPVSEAKNTQTFDPFAISDSNTPRDTKSPVSASTNTATFDPFAAIPMNNFEESDSFGDFTSHAESETTRPKQNVVNSVEQSSKPAVKKGGFQVKSGIWADSLSRGIIDLNITAPKKTNLADIGIVGGLDDSQEEKEKGLPTTWYMGKAMGPGMGLNKGARGNFSAYASQDFRRN